MYGDHTREIRQNPIVTSVPGVVLRKTGSGSSETKVLSIRRAYLQKSGHGSYVETPLGEVYLVHLCVQTICTGTSLYSRARNCDPEDEMDRRRMASHGMTDDNLAKEYVEESKLPEYPVPQIPDFDDFDGDELGNWYYAPRIMPQRFADVKVRPGLCENPRTGIQNLSE